MSSTVNNHVNRIIPVKSEAWKPELEMSRRRSIIQEFALNTSTHGLPGIARGRSWHNRIFWTISFLIFTGIMIFFVTQSVQNYFQYPTQTSVSIVVERSQTFPAVTICNYCPARYDLLIEPFLNYTNSFNLTNTNDTNTFTPQQAGLLRNFLQYKLGRNESVNGFFFSLDSMLLSCLYNGQNCTKDDFISFVSSTYGRCYTFNAKTKTANNNNNVRQNNDNGGSGMLQLTFYANSHLYIPYVTSDVSVGMVAMIHDNTQLPLIDIAGIQLSTGRKHKLSYRKKASYFLPPPYTECTDKIPLAMQAMFNQYGDADYAYSQDVCYTLCTQAYLYQECGCVNPTQWSVRSVVLPGTTKLIETPLCDVTSTCYMNAAIRLSNTKSIWDQFCSNCTEACSTIDFIVTPSSVAAPSVAYAFLLNQSVPFVVKPLPTNWSTNWLSEIQKNYLALDIVCESTQVENFTQQPSIRAVDVLSTVGGHTGLWIGISFLSIMEFVEMLYRLLRYQYHIIKTAIRKKIRQRNEVIDID